VVLILFIELLSLISGGGLLRCLGRVAVGLVSARLARLRVLLRWALLRRALLRRTLFRRALLGRALFRRTLLLLALLLLLVLVLVLLLLLLLLDLLLLLHRIEALSSKLTDRRHRSSHRAEGTRFFVGGLVSWLRFLPAAVPAAVTSISIKDTLRMNW